LPVFFADGHEPCSTVKIDMGPFGLQQLRDACPGKQQQCHDRSQLGVERFTGDLKQSARFVGRQETFALVVKLRPLNAAGRIIRAPRNAPPAPYSKDRPIITLSFSAVANIIPSSVFSTNHFPTSCAVRQMTLLQTFIVLSKERSQPGPLDRVQFFKHLFWANAIPQQCDNWRHDLSMGFFRVAKSR
jgi:hypothetical protein